MKSFRFCTLLFLLIYTTAQSQPYYPLSGGPLQGGISIPSGSQIQAPYYGFNTGVIPPATSGNVAIFPNNYTGTLDIIGYGGGWHFIPASNATYPARVAGIDPTGNMAINKNFYAGGVINVEYGENSYFHAGNYLNIGHTSATNEPYISFNAKLTYTDVPNGVSKFTPSHAAGSGLIMLGEAGGSSLRFLQLKYPGNLDNTGQVALSAFRQVLSINNDGEVGIGMSTLAPTGYSLAVNGNMAVKRIKVTQGNGSTWPDYVFEPAYRLKPLDSLEMFVNQYRHLPEVPPASQVEQEGLDVQDTQAVLLKKIEELTLYLLELKKALDLSNKKQQEQVKEIQLLKAVIR